MRITASYSIERTPTGAKLTRKGEVDVDFISPGTRSVKQVAFKTFMRRKFEAFLKPEIESEGIKLPGRWEHAGKLVIQHLQAGDGWLALGWDLQAQRTADGRSSESQVVKQ